MKLLIMLADGFEETEALVPWDVLKRAGADVSLVSVSSDLKVKGTHGITVFADRLISEVQRDVPDAVILPGGMPGMTNLASCKTLSEMILKAYEKGALLAAICASPAVLGKLGILKNKTATCFPGFESELIGANVSSDYVCRDSNIITAKGMGASFAFAFEIVGYLFGDEKVITLKNGAQYIK